MTTHSLPNKIIEKELIPFIPLQVDASDIGEKGLILSDEIVTELQQYLETQPPNRIYRAKNLCDTLHLDEDDMPFSILKDKEGQLYAIYDGKLVQNLMNKQWFYLSVKDSTFILNEAISGITLEQLLRRPLSVHQRMNIAISLIKSVEDYYHNGFLHRNINPKQFMCDPSNHQVVLAESPFSVRAHQLSSEEQIGDPNYQAPEIANSYFSTHLYSEASEVYAIGKILQLIFPEEVLQLLPYDLRLSLQTRINHMLKTDPKERPPIEGMFLSFLKIRKMIWEAQEFRNIGFILLSDLLKEETNNDLNKLDGIYIIDDIPHKMNSQLVDELSKKGITVMGAFKADGEKEVSEQVHAAIEWHKNHERFLRDYHVADKYFYVGATKFEEQAICGLQLNQAGYSIESFDPPVDDLTKENFHQITQETLKSVEEQIDDCLEYLASVEKNLDEDTKKRCGDLLDEVHAKEKDFATGLKQIDHQLEQKEIKCHVFQQFQSYLQNLYYAFVQAKQNFFNFLHQVMGDQKTAAAGAGNTKPPGAGKF